MKPSNGVYILKTAIAFLPSRAKRQTVSHPSGVLPAIAVWLCKSKKANTDGRNSSVSVLWRPCLPQSPETGTVVDPRWKRTVSSALAPVCVLDWRSLVSFQGDEGFVGGRWALRQSKGLDPTSQRSAEGGRGFSIDNQDRHAYLVCHITHIKG